MQKHIFSFLAIGFLFVAVQKASALDLCSAPGIASLFKPSLVDNSAFVIGPSAIKIQTVDSYTVREKSRKEYISPFRKAKEEFKRMIIGFSILFLLYLPIFIYRYKRWAKLHTMNQTASLAENKHHE